MKNSSASTILKYDNYSHSVRKYASNIPIQPLIDLFHFCKLFYCCMFSSVFQIFEIIILENVSQKNIKISNSIIAKTDSDHLSTWLKTYNINVWQLTLGQVTFWHLLHMWLAFFISNFSLHIISIILTISKKNIDYHLFR